MAGSSWLIGRLARKTLGVRPRPLDEEVDGHRALAAGPHKVVLPPGARHFRPVLRCTRCGSQFVAHTRPIRTPRDLEPMPSSLQLCGGCSSTLISRPVDLSRPAGPTPPREHLWRAVLAIASGERSLGSVCEEFGMSEEELAEWLARAHTELDPGPGGS